MNCCKLIYWSVILTLAILVSCQSDTGKQEESEDTGKMIYKQFCITCHGASGTLQTSGAADLTESNLNLEERKAIIRNGKGEMTPFKNILNEDQIEAVARYTQTMQTE